MRKKLLILVLTITVVLGATIGSTVAWLTARTEPVENTFTVGSIEISLGESKDLDLRMMPGKRLKKDLKVTVMGGSEACYLFVRAEKSQNFDDFLEFEMAAGWSALPGEDGVYYREVEAVAADLVLPVIRDDTVTVKKSVTKEMMDGLKGGTYPTLTFTAYAVQRDNIMDVETAWEQL